MNSGRVRRLFKNFLGRTSENFTEAKFTEFHTQANIGEPDYQAKLVS
jgi:hypothetical protein